MGSRRSNRSVMGEHGATREAHRREGSRPSFLPFGRSGDGRRRGARYRLDLPDSETGGEGRRPGSECDSTSQGAGDWREPGNSTEAPATLRGAVHQGQAGIGLSLSALRQGVSGGHSGPRLCAQPAAWWGVGRGRRDVRGHRARRDGAKAGRSAGGAANSDVPTAAGAAGADSQGRGGERPLGIPTIRDRVVQTAVHFRETSRRI